MSLTFILILLLVIGIVFANIALLRFGSKPMPVKDKKPLTPETAAAPGKTQAATTSALPLTTPSTETNKNNIEQSKSDANVGSNGGGDNGSAGD